MTLVMISEKVRPCPRWGCRQVWPVSWTGCASAAPRWREIEEAFLAHPLGELLVLAVHLLAAGPPGVSRHVGTRRSVLASAGYRSLGG